MQCVFGAGNQNRTDDLVITNDVLYRLSHTSMSCDYDIISNIFAFVNSFLKNIFYFMLLNCSFSQKLQEIEIGFLVKNMKRQKSSAVLPKILKPRQPRTTPACRKRLPYLLQQPFIILIQNAIKQQGCPLPDLRARKQ